MKPLSTGKFFILLGIIYGTGIILWFHNERKNEAETLVEQCTREKILLVGNGGEPGSIDPAFTYQVKDGHILKSIFEGLLIVDPKTLALRPGVAIDWDISLDGMVYTYYLRHNAKFSNGDPVTAHNFVLALKRILDPSLKAPNAVFFEGIKNAKKYHEGIINDFNDVGVRVLDDYTLQIELESLDPFFSMAISDRFLLPMHKSSVEEYGALEPKNSLWLRPGNVIGNGAFILKEWNPDYIEVEKNPYYWGVEEVKLNKVRFYAMKTSEEEAHAFSRGRLHLTYRLSSKHAAIYAHRGNSCLRTIDLNAIDYYIFKTDMPPLDDIRVRQALSIGIIRENCINDVINDVFANDRKVAYNMIPDFVPYYRSQVYIKEDIQKAKDLLAEAGFPNGRGFPVLKLKVPNDKTHIGVAKAVQDMWRRNLNIGVEIIASDDVWDDFYKKDYHITRIGWINDNADLSSFFMFMVRNGCQNPKVLQYINSAHKLPDILTRLKYQAQAEGSLLEEAEVMPLFFHVHNCLVHPDVQGWQTNTLLINYYHFIDLQKSKNRIF